MAKNLNIVYVDADKLKPWERNPKKHDLDAIEKSMERFGVRWPIGVQRSTMRIFAGHGRYEVMTKRRGMKKIPVVFASLSDREAEAFALIDNQLTIEPGWDDAALAKLIDELRVEMPEMPFAELGFEKLIEKLEFDDVLTPPNLFSVFDVERISDVALKFFRDKGFPYPKIPIHTGMIDINSIAQMPDSQLRTSTLGEQFADTYHPYRYHLTAEGMRSTVDAFENDKDLRHAIGIGLKSGARVTDTISSISFIVITHGAQPLSNFRPAYAALIYRKHMNRDKGICASTRARW